MKPAACLLAIALLCSISACKKDKDDDKKDVNSVTITAQKAGTPLDAFTFGPNYKSTWMVAVGNTIYFGNGSESGNPPIARFFASYNVATNTLTKNLPTTNATCNCGYNSRLQTDGTDIYTFANEAARFRTSTKTWSVPSFPNNVKNKMGEPGTVTLNGRLYSLGGRYSDKSFIYYDVSADTWFDAPEYPVPVEEPSLVTHGGKIYAMGGLYDSTVTMFQVFDPATGLWERQPNLPFNLNGESNGYRAAVFEDRIFVLTYSGMWIYDIPAKKWNTNAVPLAKVIPEDVIDEPNLFVIGQKLYLAGMHRTENRFMLFEQVVKE